jgi:hypothetical protein
MNLSRGGVENGVQGNGQLHHPKVGTQMPSIPRKLGNQLLPNFLGKDQQLVRSQFLDLTRLSHHIEVSVHI